MKIRKENKTYNVDEVTMNGIFINVNGTTITDYAVWAEQFDNPLMQTEGYTVFCDSDEICFDTFDEAYDFAMNKQKDTFRLED